MFAVRGLGIVAVKTLHPAVCEHPE